MSDYCNLKLSSNQSESLLIRLLTDHTIVTNLTNNQYNITDTLFKLARYRKTGAIIAIFNQKQGLGTLSHQQLLNIVNGNANGNANASGNGKQ